MLFWGDRRVTRIERRLDLIEDPAPEDRVR